LPEIQLFNFSDIWMVAGPFIISAAVIIFAGLVVAILLTRMEKGTFKEVMKIIFMVGIVFIFILSLQITSKIWGS
jgi:hypothetical protein